LTHAIAIFKPIPGLEIAQGRCLSCSRFCSRSPILYFRTNNLHIRIFFGARMTWMGRSAACRTLTVNFRKSLGLSSCGEPVVPVRDGFIFGHCLISVRLVGARETFRGTYGRVGS